MPIESLLNLTATLKRPETGVGERYNLPVVTYTETTIYGRLELRSGTEDNQPRNLSRDSGTFRFLGGQVDPEVNKSDRIIINGDEYEITNVHAKNGRNGVHHYEAMVERQQ